ncbi:MAG: DUF523 domain-containing protein, partial [Deltaproteobacteria bacterium]
RYDGGSRRSARVLRLLKGKDFIPVCPEQLGGLPSPRPTSLISNGSGLDVISRRSRVISSEGMDVTRQFLKGAREALRIVKLSGATRAILKDRSPACGVNYIYQGKKLVKGMGVFTALLLREGIEVRDESGESRANKKGFVKDRKR